MIREAIIKLSKKEDLTYDEAESVMNEIMDGAATPVQMASYLTALSMKGKPLMRSQHLQQVCVHTASNFFTIWMSWRL